MLTPELVQPITEKATRLLGHTVVITDPHGEVLGAGPSVVPAAVIQAARMAAEGRRRVYLPLPNDCTPGTPPGVALPLQHQGEVIGALVISGDPVEVARYGELVQLLVEVSYQQAVQAEVRLWEISAAETLIHDMLAYREEAGPPDLLIARARAMGYHLELPRVAMIVHAYTLKDLEDPGNGRGSQLPAQRSLVVRTLKDALRETPQDLIGPFESDRFVILKTIPAAGAPEAVRQHLKDLGGYMIDLLLKRCRLECSIGIGMHHPGMAGLAASFRDSVQALAVGRRLTPEPGVYLVDELGLGHILCGISDSARARFIEGTLGWQMDEDSALVHTLLMFCSESLNLSEAARSLFLHRNTLFYRLEQIKRLTGLDPRKFEDAVQLYLAIKLRKFHVVTDAAKPADSP